MRIVILTGMGRGMASLALPALRKAGHDVAGVIYSEEQIVDRKKWFRRRLKKVVRIGLLGAINGIRMRDWFGDAPAALLGIGEIAEVAAAHGVPFETTPAINTDRTVELMTRFAPDIALSLGNSYIGKRVFSIPRYGMLNIHHELLPEYRGAQTLLWELHDGRAMTGYTIHRIDATIDGGAILLRREVPADLAPALRDSVIRTCAKVYAASIDGLLEVLSDFESFADGGSAQGRSGRSFTTPTFGQYLKIARNHRRLAAEARH